MFGETLPLLVAGKEGMWRRNGVHETCPRCLKKTWGLYRSQLSTGASSVAQQVKNPPAMQELQETWVWSLGQEDPLEEASGKSHGQRSLVGYSPWGHKEWNTTKVTEHTRTSHRPLGIQAKPGQPLPSSSMSEAVFLPAFPPSKRPLAFILTLFYLQNRMKLEACGRKSLPHQRIGNCNRGDSGQGSHHLFTQTLESLPMETSGPGLATAPRSTWVASDPGPSLPVFHGSLRIFQCTINKWNQYHWHWFIGRQCHGSRHRLQNQMCELWFHCWLTVWSWVRNVPIEFLWGTKKVSISCSSSSNSQQLHGL